jgi:hypothetical protein
MPKQPNGTPDKKPPAIDQGPDTSGTIDADPRALDGLANYCCETAVAGSVIATEQLQRLEPDERDDVLNRAKRVAQPSARPMITTNLLAADIELGEQSAAMSN